MSAGDASPKRQDSTAEFPGLGGSLPATQDRAQELAQICLNHHTALVRLLAVRMGSIEDAKELVQEAYLKALAFDRPGTMRLQPGYIWRIAANLAIDRMRERASRERSCHTMLSLVEKLEVSAESTAEAQERLTVVERAIRESPPKCVEAFVLHVMRGLTFDEVGREMRISGRMARKYLARMLEHLQARLDAADTARGPR